MDSEGINTAIFWICVVIGIPFAIVLSLISKKFMKVIFFIMLVSLSFYYQLSIFFLRDPLYYRGQDITGLVVHLSDLCAIILFVAMFLQGKIFTWRIPLFIPYALFFCSATISWLLTAEQLPSDGVFPYYTKFNAFLGLYILIKGYFLMLVVFHYVDDKEKIKEMFFGLAALVIVSTIIGLENRYVRGDHRVGGETSHPNIFGGLMGMVSIAFLPLIYAQSSLRKAVFPGIVLAFGLIGIILSISRAALAAYFLIACPATVLCLIRFPTMKNWTTLALCMVCVGFMTLKSYGTLADRLYRSESIEGGLVIRHASKQFAYKIWKDNMFFGVGLNNYMAFAQGRYLAQNEEYRVHHIFVLLLTETGIAGACFFLLQWGRIAQMFFATLCRGTVRKDAEVFAWVLGLACSFAVFHLIGLFEFFYFEIYFFSAIHIFLGLISRIYYDTKTCNIENSKLFLKQKS